MSRYYARIKGTRGEATRQGHATSGIYGNIGGWNVGGHVSMRPHKVLAEKPGKAGPMKDSGRDEVHISTTGGSNCHNISRDICTIIEAEGGSREPRIEWQHPDILAAIECLKAEAVSCVQALRGDWDRGDDFNTELIRQTVERAIGHETYPEDNIHVERDRGNPENVAGIDYDKEPCDPEPERCPRCGSTNLDWDGYEVIDDSETMNDFFCCCCGAIGTNYYTLTQSSQTVCQQTREAINKEEERAADATEAEHAD